MHYFAPQSSFGIYFKFFLRNVDKGHISLIFNCLNPISRDFKALRIGQKKFRGDYARNFATQIEFFKSRISPLFLLRKNFFNGLAGAEKGR